MLISMCDCRNVYHVYAVGEAAASQQLHERNACWWRDVCNVTQLFLYNNKQGLSLTCREFLTGFRKRKLQRRKEALTKLETKDKQERQEVRAERRKQFKEELGLDEKYGVSSASSSDSDDADDEVSSCGIPSAKCQLPAQISACNALLFLSAYVQKGIIISLGAGQQACAVHCCRRHFDLHLQEKYSILF